jgi:hypothetical protein
MWHQDAIPWQARFIESKVEKIIRSLFSRCNTCETKTNKHTYIQTNKQKTNSHWVAALRGIVLLNELYVDENDVVFTVSVVCKEIRVVQSHTQVHKLLSHVRTAVPCVPRVHESTWDQWGGSAAVAVMQRYWPRKRPVQSLKCVDKQWAKTKKIKDKDTTKQNNQTNQSSKPTKQALESSTSRAHHKKTRPVHYRAANAAEGPELALSSSHASTGSL